MTEPDVSNPAETLSGAPWFVRFMQAIVAILIFAITAVMFTDVVGRYFFNHSIRGGFEIIALMLGTLIFSTASLNAFRNDHLVVGLLDGVFAGRPMWLRDVLVRIISVVALGFIAERMWGIGNIYFRSGQPGELLDIKMWPFAYGFAVLTAIACLVALLGLWHHLRQGPPPRTTQRERVSQ